MMGPQQVYQIIVNNKMVNT